MYSVRVFIINLIQFVGGPRRRVLMIGGSFSGLAAGRDLGSHYLVTIIDAKEQRSGTTVLVFLQNCYCRWTRKNIKRFVVDQASSEIFLQIVSTLLWSAGCRPKPWNTLQAEDMLLRWLLFCVLVWACVCWSVSFIFHHSYWGPPSLWYTDENSDVYQCWITALRRKTKKIHC